MDLDINALREQLGLDKVAKAVESINAAQEADRLAKEKAAREEAETARVKSIVDAAIGSEKTKLEEAHTLVKTLETKLAQSNEAFAQTVEKLQSEITAKSTEISQILAARDGRAFVANPVAKAMLGDQAQFEKSVESVVLLGFSS